VGLRAGLFALGLCAAFAGWATPGGAQAVSGAYGSLTLGVEPASGVVTGYFREALVGNGSERAPQFVCAFALLGAPAGADAYDVAAWSPGDGEVFVGSLGVERDTVSLSFEDWPGGCAAVLGGEAIYDFRLERRGDWTAVRVLAAKAQFHDGPAGRALKPYVVPGDPVRVYATRDGWVDAAFAGGRGSRGWLAETALFPAEPPEEGAGESAARPR